MLTILNMVMVCFLRLSIGCNFAASWKRRIASPVVHQRSATADVQTLVEFLIQLLLLGAECRQLLLLVLFRRRARRKRLRKGLQMADRRLRHRGYRSSRGSALPVLLPRIRVLTRNATARRVERMDKLHRN